MAVFTVVSDSELEPWLQRFHVGRLVSIEGIVAGIENTNYRVTTEHLGQKRRFVLTLLFPAPILCQTLMGRFWALWRESQPPSSPGLAGQI